MRRTLVFVFMAGALACAHAGVPDILWDDRPADGNWQNSWYPLGSGALGAMVSGGTDHFEVQFNADTFWTGGKNLSNAVNDRDTEETGPAMGKFKAFGVLDIVARSIGPVDGYRRELDLSRALYSDGFTAHGAGWRTGDSAFARRAFASRADNLIAVDVEAGENVANYFEVQLRGKHGERIECQMGGGTKELSVPPFELNPGNNLLVIRCDHREWQRQFAFDLVSEKGDDLSDLRIGWK